jgi:uncharacterized protein (DUF2252 family)
MQIDWKNFMTFKSVSRAKSSSEGAVLTREERLAAGRALRNKIPRTTQADWQAPSDRRDPIGLLLESDKDRLSQLIPIRYSRMIQSPFAFYRGAVAIMAADLANTPTSGIYVQSCGDCHLMNFGGFATPERRHVFDINDFDETLPAPWEWDVKRLATSIVIAGRHNGFKKTDTLKGAIRCVQSYREHLQAFAELDVLCTWYEQLDAEALLVLIQSRKWKKTIKKQISRATSRSVLEDYFPKLVSVKGGRFHIKDKPPLIFHQSRPKQLEFEQAIFEAFSRYRESLTDDLKVLIDRYQIKDIAMKVVGVGSVGMHCGILLMVTSDGEPLFLQVKEARASVLEQYAGKSNYLNNGQRVVAGQKLMQPASDMFLGWTDVGNRHYYVRQLLDMKIKPLVEGFDAPMMVRHAEYCGWALARAHARSGNAAMISGYLGKSDKFDRAIATFAVTYADQNEQDYQALIKAVEVGKIETSHSIKFR